MSFLNRKRLDGAVYIKHQDSLILFEGKRIRQGKAKSRYNSEIALQEIYRDASRLLEQTRIDSVKKRVQASYIYRVFIAEIWLDKSDNMKEAHSKWLSGEAFPKEWEKGVFSESKEAYKGRDSSYKFLIAICPTILY